MTASATVTAPPASSAEASDSSIPTGPSTTTPPGTVEGTPTSTEGSDPPRWVWLVVLLLVAAAVAWLLVATSRRRRWRTAFETQLGEARWVCTTLVPSLLDLSAPPDELTGRWVVGEPRLDDLQAALATLTGTAPGSRDKSRVARVSAEAAALREALVGYLLRRSAAGPGAQTNPEVEESRATAQARSDALRTAVDDVDRMGQSTGEPPTGESR